MALRESELPEGCTRTIYMCDDGKDPLKRDWVESLPDDVIYVSGECRIRHLVLGTCLGVPAVGVDEQCCYQRKQTASGGLASGQSDH